MMNKVMDYSTWQDNELLAELARFDKATFEPALGALVNRYQRLGEHIVKRIAQGSVRLINDHDVILQEVWLKIVRSIRKEPAKFQSDFRFPPFFWTCVEHMTIDYARRKPQPKLAHDWELTEASDLLDRPRNLLEFHTLIDSLDKHFHLLPSDVAEVLRLYFWEELTLDAIAKKLDMCLGNVHRLKKKGLLILKSQLGAQGFR
jgi:RNA polymerase sigma factor (sigma-70 family)